MVDAGDDAFQNVLAIRTDQEVVEAQSLICDIMSVVRPLGGHGGAYKRDSSSALRAVVSELYSPPRVSAAAKTMPQYQCIPGLAIDPTTNDSEGKPLDFDDAAQRQQA